MHDLWGWSFERSSVLTDDRVRGLFGALVLSLDAPGAVAEFGVYQGETARELARYLAAHGSPKTVHLFESCAGLPPAADEDIPVPPPGVLIWPPPGLDRGGGEYVASAETIKATMGDLPNYRLHVGWFATYAGVFTEPLCFAHVDADRYAGTRDALAIVQACLVPGGWVVVDDYGSHWVGVTRAVDEGLRPDSRFVCLRRPGQLLATRRLEG
jgi:O-methyltransferase